MNRVLEHAHIITAVGLLGIFQCETELINPLNQKVEWFLRNNEICVAGFLENCDRRTMEVHDWIVT